MQIKKSCENCIVTFIIESYSVRKRKKAYVNQMGKKYYKSTQGIFQISKGMQISGNSHINKKPSPIKLYPQYTKTRTRKLLYFLLTPLGFLIQ